jgi:hypothetical protein
MDTSDLQLTPEMRAALSANPGGVLYIADKETRKYYLLFEQGALPELEEEYIRDGLERAREQIAAGEVSTASGSDDISKAQMQPSAKS